jgi:hypothetical protein
MNRYILETGNNITLAHQFTDDTFNRESAYKCSLVLQKNDTHWNVAAFDTAATFLFLKTHTPSKVFFDVSAEIAELTSVIPEILFEFKDVFYIHPGKKVTLIPKPLYKEEFAEEFFKINHVLLGSEILLENKIKSFDSVVVFPLERHYQKGLFQHFPSLKILHASVPFIENALLFLRNAEEIELITDIDEEQIRIAAVEKGNLKFFNTFSYKTKEDLLYYLMFVSDQLNLNPDKSRYHFSGLIFRNSEIFRMLYKYFRNPLFLSLSDHVSVSDKFDKTSPHLFSTLLGAPLCE